MPSKHWGLQGQARSWPHALLPISHGSHLPVHPPTTRTRCSHSVSLGDMSLLHHRCTGNHTCQEPWPPASRWEVPTEAQAWGAGRDRVLPWKWHLIFPTQFHHTVSPAQHFWWVTGSGDPYLYPLPPQSWGLRWCLIVCLCACLVDFIFRAILGAQQNWAEGTEISHIALAFCPYTQPPLLWTPSTSVGHLLKSAKPTLTQEDRDRGKRGQCAEAVGRQGKET